MKYSMKLKGMRAEKIEAAKKLVAVADAANRVLSEAEQTSLDALHAEAATLRTQIEKAEAQEKAEAELNVVEPSVVVPGQTATPAVVMPVEPKIYGSLRYAPNAKFAYRFGVWVAATIFGADWAKKAARDMFAPKALVNEGTNTQGGYLVIEEFLNELIRLVEKQGVFRRKCRVVPMHSDTLALPRRTGGLTAYPVGEGAAGTESTMAWDRVNLTAKKWMVLTRMSSEVNEDSVANLGDQILGEIALAFATAEDAAGFLGDGTSTYAGVVGLKNALAAGAKVTQGTSNTWAAQVLGDFNALCGKMPDYTIGMSPEFYCNKAYFHNVMERLAMAAGGATAIEIVNGVAVGRFFGYPVNFVACLPSVTATTGIMAYFGDLGAAAKFGDRRIMTIEMSREASVGGHSMWERDEIGIKGTERFDINVHEVGTSTAGGPINAIITG